MSEDTGGQAFPCVNPQYDGNWNKEPIINGMTLRDYFAAKALPSILMAEAYGCNYQPANRPNTPHGTYAAYWASEAYIIADAMLKEREK